jgi:hypothetical protein
MKGKHSALFGNEIVADGSTRIVEVLDVYRRPGCQVLACYAEETEEGFVFAIASESPRIAIGDPGVITYRRDRENGGRWDFAKGVGS